MPLPRTLFAPVFRHQHLGRSFVAIVGIMVFIASFATAAESALLTQGYLWGRSVETRITVEIPSAGDEAAMPQAERVKQAIAVLRGLPDVGLVMPLSDEEVARLLQPWFEQPELLKALPLPTLIDIERKPGTHLTAAKIQDALKGAVADAHVDDHGAWTQDVWRLVNGLSLLGGVMIALMAIALMVTVSLICRAVVASEHETISLLHLLGANDTDIARHFQMQAQRLSLRAAGAGFAAAGVVAGILMLVAHPVADLSTMHLGHWIQLVVSVFLIPVGAILLSSVTVRYAVMRLIKAFP